jgi:hypothetical protein
MKYLALLIIVLFATSSCSSLINVLTKKKNPVSKDSISNPIDYAIWDNLLNKHVKENGLVDYKGFKEDAEDFNTFITLLENNHPNDKNWSEDETLAYWINAYNAFTVKLIVDNYPVESIKKVKKGVPFINSVWDIDFISIEGISYSLGNIEHGILRKSFNEPKIHFAINCASISCPNLFNEAFTPEKLEAQLNKTAEVFLYDKTKNRLASIFNWYKVDFTKDTSLTEYIQQFVSEDISNKKVSYLDYDWGLNDVK